MRRHRQPPIIEASFLRAVDARTKLALSLATSVAVMLPLRPLTALFIGYLGLTAAAGLMRHAMFQLRRIALLLCLLFALDWFFIGFEFAVLISLRLALLVTAFNLVTATTTPDEVRIASERLWVPPRLAFVFATAYSALALLEGEWHGIVEAQRARGIQVGIQQGQGWRAWRQQVASLVSFLVPAIVLVTQRAWSISEAASTRGLESPVRRLHGAQPMSWLDGMLLAGTATIFLGLFAIG